MNEGDGVDVGVGVGVGVEVGGEEIWAYSRHNQVTRR